ncbi:hypothetical protein [Paenibacillus cymbidii]|uniref:hypothetical protein n=1 Tax=Paenibacillus cymbidii TaxID=1639034 RepID=UPI001080DB37|nr:hypothetical protein [Paenibacillus cymbidii]
MKVKIESPRHGQGKVFIDGEEVKEVVSVNVFVGVNNLTTVSLELVADEVEIDLQQAVSEQKGRTL